MTDFKITRAQRALVARRTENACCRSLFNWSCYPTSKRQHGRRNRTPKR